MEIRSQLTVRTDYCWKRFGVESGCRQYPGMVGAAPMAQRGIQGPAYWTALAASIAEVSIIRGKWNASLSPSICMYICCWNYGDIGGAN
jgi:hypothetical protein